MDNLSRRRKYCSVSLQGARVAVQPGTGISVDVHGRNNFKQPTIASRSTGPMQALHHGADTLVKKIEFIMVKSVRKNYKL